LIETLAGNQLLPGMDAIAALYAGHQFGHYVSQLGDGRAILLGEVKNAAGEGWEVQLKGAGRTPYSRGGDGRAVLRSSIREFLCSEAMHALGIPTTRALCIVGSDRPVYREDEETAALVTRLAPSFVRFGSFEVFYYRNQVEPIKQLADYVIERYYPDLKNLADPYPEFLRQVALRTAELMAQWQAVGFSHGVMNTDNMSILGLTLDYGPFGFLDAFDPGYVCNHSDTGGRYAFDQQPDVAAWNITKLAQALVPLMSVETASQAIGEYPQVFGKAYLERMAAKFGLTPGSETAGLVMDALQLLAQNRVDYTIFLRRLCDFDSRPEAVNTTAARSRPRPRCLRRLGSVLRRRAAPARIGRYRTRCGNARGQSQIHPAQPSGRNRHSPRRGRTRLQRGQSPARVADAAIRRAAGKRGLRRRTT
jgi:serine/tyrosine/threonine adenylyltransferase